MKMSYGILSASALPAAGRGLAWLPFSACASVVLWLASSAGVALGAPQGPGETTAGASHSGASRPYLGVWVGELDSNRARELGLKADRGIVVTRVVEGSPAARAGVREWDAIVRFGGQPVGSVEEFRTLLLRARPGDRISFTIQRNGKFENIAAVLTRGSARPAPPLDADEGMSLPDLPGQTFGVDMPRPLFSWDSAVLGLEAEELAPPLADYFGVRQGVLVRGVLPESPAEQAGFRPGDVIFKVNAAEVKSPGEVSEILRKLEGSERKAVQLGVVRSKRPLNMQVDLTWEPPTGAPRVRSANQR
jgi:serine protease Do